MSCRSSRATSGWGSWPRYAAPGTRRQRLRRQDGGPARLWQAQPAGAGRLRLLGPVLYDPGDLTRAEAALREGLEVAAAAGAPALQARIRVLIADIHNLQGGGAAEALEDCESAIGVLESEGDLSGLAEAWLVGGRHRYDRA